MILFHHLHRPGLLHLREQDVPLGQRTVLAFRHMLTEETHSCKVGLTDHVACDAIVAGSTRSESSWLLEGREQHLDFIRTQISKIRDFR